MMSLWQGACPTAESRHSGVTPKKPQLVDYRMGAIKTTKPFYFNWE